MFFGGRLSVFWCLAALLLMTSVRGGELDGGFPDFCEYCQLGDLIACNDSLATQIEEMVNCEYKNETCVLGVAKSFDDAENLTMTTFVPDLVCLLKVDNASELIPSPLLGTTLVNSSLEVFDYPFNKVAIFLKSEAFGKLEDADVKATECFSCDSSSDEACLGDVDNLEAIKCDMPNECVSVLLDGHLIRNCSSAFPDTVLDLCRKPDAISCKLCQTPKCNNMPWKQCYQCGPSDGLNCTLSSSIPTEICPNYDDECSVRITMAGDTVRECSRPGTACPSAEICSSCVEALCNSAVFPANRSRCIQCIDCEEKQDPSTALPCTRYSADEKCFMVTFESQLIRGCMSDPEGMAQCDANATTCVTCDDRDGCNDMPRMKEPSLSCHNCISTDDISCGWRQQSENLAKCQNKVPFYLQETCMMSLDNKTQVAVRACSFDHGACSPKDSNCHTCSGDGCNSGNLIFQDCIQCSSDIPGQESCSGLPQGIPSTKCAKQTAYRGRGCVTVVKGNVTARGCISDITKEVLDICNRELNYRCLLCFAKGCNNQNLKGQECIQCRSDAPGQESCSQQASWITASKCHQKSLILTQKGCYTMTKGNLTTRGCIMHLTTEEKKYCTEGRPYLCQLCGPNGCNRNFARAQECIQCSSDEPGMESCSEMAEGIPSKKCSVETLPFQNRGCFTTKTDNETRRGCLGELTPYGIQWCSGAGKAQCHLCSGDGCNNKQAPSAAQKAFVTLFLTWILSIFVLV